MHSKILIFAVFLAVPAGAAMAEPTTLNHLDCYFNESTQAIACPDILPTGRASAEPAVTRTASEAPASAADAPASAADGKPAKGSAEWNAYCAGKYNSFDPDTGTYTSYTGKTKPCR